MNDIEYERTYDANNPVDRYHYTLYLWRWATERWAEVQREQSTQQGTSEQLTWIVPKEYEVKGETWWFCTKYGGYTRTPTGKPISECVLRTTGTQTGDWTKGQSPERRQWQAEGTIKRSGSLALQRLLQILQRNSEESFRIDYTNGDRWY